MSAAQITTAQFLELLRGEKPVLVDFCAPRCGYCRRLSPVCDRIAETFADTLVVAKIDVDEEPALADREQIEVIPTLVLYRGGKALDAMVAPQSMSRIEEFLHKTLENSPAV